MSDWVLTNSKDDNSSYVVNIMCIISFETFNTRGAHAQYYEQYKNTFKLFMKRIRQKICAHRKEHKKQATTIQLILGSLQTYIRNAYVIVVWWFVSAIRDLLVLAMSCDECNTYGFSVTPFVDCGYLVTSLLRFINYQTYA